MVFSSSEVFPEPGELIRLTAQIPRTLRKARTCSASRSFFASSRSSRTSVSVP